MRMVFIICLSCLCPMVNLAQATFTKSVILQQAGIYYTSDRVTAYGYGIGTGISLNWEKGLTAQADVNLLWTNGNLVASRLAIGYHIKRKWSPGFYLATTLLAGHKTEVLDDQGQRPPSVTWAGGFRILPFYFAGSKGYISALELGYGIGADEGQFLEITILSAGLKW